jgi:hypothetical protein
VIEHELHAHWWAAVASATRMTGDLALAEDAVQEACLAALAQWSAHAVPANPRAWLISTARHKALDQIRRETRREAKERAAALDLHQAATTSSGSARSSRPKATSASPSPASPLADWRAAIELSQSQRPGGKVVLQIGPASERRWKTSLRRFSKVTASDAIATTGGSRLAGTSFALTPRADVVLHDTTYRVVIGRTDSQVRFKVLLPGPLGRAGTSGKGAVVLRGRADLAHAIVTKPRATWRRALISGVAT